MGLAIIIAVLLVSLSMFFVVKNDLDLGLALALIIASLCVAGFSLAITTPSKFDKQKYTKSDTVVEVVAIEDDLLFKNNDSYISIFSFPFDSKEPGEKLSVRKIVRATDKTFYNLASDSSKYILIIPKSFAEKLSK
jgi:hypothetical protein